MNLISKITLFFLTMTTTLLAEEPPMQNVDAEIKALESQLADYRKKALNAEMNAQPLMFDNWHEYAQDIRLSEEDEKRILEIKKHLQELRSKKQALESPR